MVVKSTFPCIKYSLGNIHATRVCSATWHCLPSGVWRFFVTHNLRFRKKYMVQKSHPDAPKATTFGHMRSISLIQQPIWVLLQWALFIERPLRRAARRQYPLKRSWVAEWAFLSVFCIRDVLEGLPVRASKRPNGPFYQLRKKQQAHPNRVSLLKIIKGWP